MSFFVLIKKGRILSSLLLACLYASPSAAAEIKLYFRLDSFSYSAPVSIRAAIDQWETNHFKSGKKQWSSNWLEIGVRKNNWHLGFLQRLEMDLQFSPDTSLFYYNTQNKLPVDSNYQQQLSMNAQRYQLNGARVGNFVDINPQFSLDWGLSIFTADDLIDGEIYGDQTTLHLDYVYSEDVVLDRRVEQPDGWGASLDLKTFWSPSAKTQIEMRIEDLLGTIWWDNAPFTRADASSNRNTYDENGYLVIQPVASGVEGYINEYRQTLKPKIQLDAKYDLNNFGLESGVYHRDSATLLMLGVSKQLRHDQKVTARLWSEIEAVELIYQHGPLELSLALDAPERNRTHTLFLTVSYGIH